MGTRLDSGTVLEERYRIDGVLGEGGMGTVYRATHLLLGNRTVALKEMRTDSLSPSEQANAAQQFMEEVRLLASVQHPGLVAVTDCFTRDGRLFMVMEYVDGTTLEQVVEQAAGPLPIRQVTDWLLSLCEVLDYLHTRTPPIILRDIKPANVMLDRRGHIRVIDFGIARLFVSGERTGAYIHGSGSVGYSPVEQFSGSTDPRSDIYALGATVYALLTRCVPPLSLAMMNGEATLIPPIDLRPDIPPQLNRLILSMLELQRDRRCQSVREVHQALTGAAPPPVEETVSMSQVVDDNVQFTVYRPRTMAPMKWYPMLVFAHLEELAADAAPDTPDPMEEVKRKAERALGSDIFQYKDSTADSRQEVPRGGELRFLPRVDGIQFNPPEARCLWLEAVHKTEFEMRAPTSLAGQTARGAVSVYLGRILLAELTLTVRVEGATAKPQTPPARETARPYRKIYASFAPEDTGVVAEFERYARVAGDTYVSNMVMARQTGRFGPELAHTIDEADVFQLFWSSNSMRNPLVEAEWRHALSLSRSGFIRPVYWDRPMPGSPPLELLQQGFQDLGGPLAPPSQSQLESQGVPTVLPSSPPRAMPLVQAAPTQMVPKARSGLHFYRLVAPAAVVLVIFLAGLSTLFHGGPSERPVGQLPPMSPSFGSGTSAVSPSRQPEATASQPETHSPPPPPHVAHASPSASPKLAQKRLPFHAPVAHARPPFHRPVAATPRD